MDRGTWQATVHRVAKSRTELKRLGRHKLTFRYKIHALFSGNSIFLCVNKYLKKLLIETVFRKHFELRPTYFHFHSLKGFKEKVIELMIIIN